MQENRHAANVEAIKEIVAQQFQSLRWTQDSLARLDAFLEDFFADAPLCPAARPVKRQTSQASVARMASLAQGKLKTSHEEVLGVEVTVFGNVTVVV